jgi:hypothetical protein
MTDDTGRNQGEEYKVGDKHPPIERQFGKPGGNKRNRFGRPKSFDALRKLAVKIAGENVPDSEVTRIEAMLRVMSSSRLPADRALFLAYAYGKPKEQVEHSGEVATKVVIEYANDNDQATAATPSPAPGEAGTPEV